MQDSATASMPQMTSQGLASRYAALQLLEKVFDKKQPLEQLLSREDAYMALAQRDRSFTRMLVSTTLRFCMNIDRLILTAMDSGTPPHPRQLHHVLRIGVAQLVYMNAPSHAVVDTAVRLAQQVGLKKQKGLVNAVLRRLSDADEQLEAVKQITSQSVPDWLYNSWEKAYGADIALQIVNASLCEAPLDMTVRTDKPGAKIHQEMLLAQYKASLLPGGTLRFQSPVQVEQLPGYSSGDWWIQDIAASLPVKLLGDLRGQSVLEFCAAPGGKTAQLATEGAQVWALDRAVKRMKTLEANMERLGLSEQVETVIADGGEYTPKDAPGRILLDAPCTATGTIRRHPDVMLLKSEQDMQNLAQVQQRLLAHAFEVLAPGGILVYCTCSLQHEEGEDQIREFLLSHSNAERVPITKDDVFGIEGIISPQGDLRSFPFCLAAHGGMDGFFASRIRKAA